ncbi:MAG TPA: sulfite exporter TauE/SafE family protein [Deltaproteobacteria bacterium]|nr:sulfite exporter TauE/SafE family protein [Deltaproteobacteria bacterium]
MDLSQLTTILICIALIAVLYSCVGHGGASGYIAVMTLFGLAPIIIKPTALVLNILVSGIAAIQFYRAGYFRWPLFWRFALTSVPCAYIGGYFFLPIYFYKYIIVLVLWFSAVRLFIRPVTQASSIRVLPLPLTLTIGAILGLLSGFIGVGGGIFLSPLLLLAGWAGNRETAAVSAFFVLVNSCAGLLGFISGNHTFPAQALTLSLAAVCGGIIGSYLGSRKLQMLSVQRVLSMILILAGYKIIFS